MPHLRDVSAEAKRKDMERVKKESAFYGSKESLFYGFAAEAAAIYRALISKGMSPSALTSLLRTEGLRETMARIRHQNSDTVPTLDPELVNLEHLMITELFSNPYVYTALDAPGSIRVLILHPGNPSDPLRGSIRIQAYSRVCYEAVSYTWGNDSTPCSILLDRQQMPITRSLFEALTRLRYQYTDRILWADGICINQEDDEEKAIQIGLMPDIFTQARVLVYLGEEADGSELLPDLLENLSRVNLKGHSGRSLSGILAANNLPHPADRSWKALVAFLCRPWFLRIWVVQEVVLAREVCFLCGEWKIHWRTLAHMADQIGMGPLHTSFSLHFDESDVEKAAQASLSLGMMLGLRLTRSAVSQRLEEVWEGMQVSEKNDAPDTSAIIGCVTQKEYVLQSCSEYPGLLSLIEGLVLALPDQVRPAATPIIKLFGMFFRNEASKPQDRLYALVGLAGDVTLADLPPDYGETVERTNARFGRKLVEKGQGMDLLYHASKWYKDVDQHIFPSWAAEWTRPRNRENHWLKLQWAYADGFDPLSNASLSNVRLSRDDADVLRVSGFRLDTCQASVVRFFDFCDSHRDPRARLKRFFEQTSQLFSGTPYFTNETWAEVACRTLIANHTPHGLESKPFSTVVQQYEEIRSFITETEIDELRSWMGIGDVKKPNEWFGSMVRYMRDFAVCKTPKGYVGIVPDMTVSTDQIFMLKGSNLPFVLRPSSLRQGYYGFVGGCYVHGMMGGEAWKMRSGDELSEIVLI